jgi:hypothetical protein
MTLIARVKPSASMLLNAPWTMLSPTPLMKLKQELFMVLREVSVVS